MTTELVVQAISVSRCGFMLLDRDRGVLKTDDSYFHSDHEPILSEFPLTCGIVGRTIRGGVPFRAGDVKSDPDYFEFDPRTRSQMCLPLHAGGEVIGVMNLEDRQLGRFSDADEQVLILALDFVSSAIERCWATEELRSRQIPEDDLVQSARKFRDLADAIPQIVWIADADGSLTNLNAKATEYTGIGTANLTGWSWDKVIHPDDLPETVMLWNECLKDGQPRDIALRIRRADGTYRWHITRQVPVSDDSGRITTWYGTCTDVEELKRTEASLQESESRFRLLMEGAADAIVWADAESGLLTNCNHAAEVLLGRKRHEIIGQPQSFLYPPEDVTRCQELFGQLVLHQIPAPSEVQVIHKDGTRIDVAVSPSVTQIKGQRIIQGIFRDISSRKKAEQTIQKLSSFRETIIRTAAEGICVCFPVADFPYVAFSVWNDRMTEITGYTMEEINSLGWYQTLYPDPDIRAQAIQRMAAMRTGEDLRGEEWDVACKGGGSRTISISTSIIEMEDGVSAVAALIQDITAQKQAVQMLRDSERELKLFRDLVNWTNDTIHVIDPATSRFLDVNERACERLGYTRQEILKLGVIDIDSNLPDLFAWKDHVRTVAAAGSMLLEGIQCRKDGTQFPVEVNVRHVVVDQKEYLVAIARDISERRHAEAVRLRTLNELRTSEERFSKLFHASPFSIIVASYPDGRIVEANEAFLRLFEFQLQDVIGRTTGDLGIWEDSEERQRMLDALKSHQSARNMEYQFRTQSGRPLSLMMSVELIQLDGALYSLAMSIDITDRKKAEQALRESETRYRSLFETCGDAIFILDLQGGIRSANPAAARMHGYEVHEIVGMSIRDLDVPSDAEQVHDRMKLLLSEQNLHFEVVHRHRDGSEFPLDVVATLLRTETEPLVLSFDRDITERKRTEQALATSELKYRTLINATQAVTWSCPASGDHVHPQQEWMDFTGQTFAQMSGEGWIDAIHPDDVSAVRARWQHSISSGEDFVSEHRVQRRDREWRWMNMHAVPFRDSEGRIVEWIGINFDMTPQKRMEETLRHILEAIAPTSGEDYFHGLVKHLSRVCEMDYAFVGVVEPDRASIRTLAVACLGETVPNFTYLLANTPCERLMNLDFCLFPKNIQQQFPEDQLLSLMGIESYAGVPLKSMDGRVTGLIVMLSSRELTNTQAAETLLRVVARQAAAELERGVSETARQAAIRLLQDSEAFLRMAQEAAHVGSWEWDVEANRFKWSAEFAKTYVTSHGGSEESSDCALKFADRESAGHFDAFLRKLRSGQETEGVECRIHRLTGTVCDLWFVGQFHSDDNKPSGKVLGVAIDITDRKLEEENRRRLSSQLAQAQKMEAIGRLAGGVAHDFNNLLTVINGYSKLLQELSPSDQEWPHMLFEISEAGARAASLTQQLLNYSRKQVIDRRVFDVNDVVRRMENMLRQLIGEDVRLQVTYHPEPVMVRADAGQIGQVVMNLAVNARDAMPGGGVLRITVSVVRPAPELLKMYPGAARGDFVQLSVRDSGVGIPGELLDRIFEPFFTTKGTGMGTGLGLASVRSIAEDGQGFVCVTSVPYQGSDFQFHLPMIVEDTPASVVKSPKASRGRATILLVEDEGAVRAVMRRFLEHFGYSVLDAANATEAVSVAEHAAGSIDLLITDVVMPETGGRELVEQIRLRWPTMKYLYVSGYSTDDVVRRGVLHSKVAFLQKPFSPEALASKVREVLADSGPGGEHQDS